MEGQQLGAILDQAFGGFRVFRLEGFDEQIEGLVGIFARLGLPDIMQHFLGLGPGALGGGSFSTLPVLCTQHRCWRVAGKTSSSAAQTFGAFTVTKLKHPWTNGQVERMNRTIKEATVKRFHDETHDQLERHLSDFLDAYNYARRLKTLSGLTPYEFICKTWTSEPERFNLNPCHQMPGLNS